MKPTKPALRPPRLYLPPYAPESPRWQKWAVIACDQYTSQPERWEAIEKEVGQAPSTLNLILPEVYLESPDRDKRVEAVRRSMFHYLREGLLQPQEAGYLLIDRSTPHVPSRKGLLAAVDLEEYSFETGAGTQIRPTEGTILDRIPPRIEIRRGAPLELPHIMLLINDPGNTLFGPLTEGEEDYPLIYSFDLMEGAGHLTGRRLPPEENGKLENRLAALTQEGFLFAVGDGNHSLATAKTAWEELKRDLSPEEQESHPARFALAEIVNICDPGVPFEPIHRILEGVDVQEFLAFFSQRGYEIQKVSPEKAERAVSPAGAMAAGLFTSEAVFLLTTNNQQSDKEEALLVEMIQPLIDQFMEDHPSSSIDYIHGTRELKELSSRPGNLGILLPPLDKNLFFQSIAQKGPMPRKTFSMGEAEEKRFYVESRRITL